MQLINLLPRLPKNSRRIWQSSLALFVACSLSQGAFAQNPGKITNATRTQITALVKDKIARTVVQQKVDSHLLAGAELRRRGFINKAVPKLRTPVQVETDGRVLVDIDARVTAELLRAIETAGGTVLGSYPREKMVQALLPLEKIEQVAMHDEVRFVRPAAKAMLSTGAVDTEGDEAHLANAARVTGAKGQGITVGVLSDSIDNSQGSLAAAIASGDIDGNNYHVLPGQAGSGEAEGLAMMEIVHDLAPYSPLYFATGFNGEAQMAQNIRDLATAGCKVIIDDVSYFDESPFEDGVISQAVNDVSAQGVLYFSSARNSGNKVAGTSGTWEGDFVDGGDASSLETGARYHAFRAGTVEDEVTDVDDPRADLFWSDPLGGSSNDYDLFILDGFGDVVDYSDNTQDGTQDPYEEVGTLSSGEFIVIIKYSGLGRFLHLDTGRCQIAINTDGCVRGHNASGAANAFSVAAIDAQGRTTPFIGGTSVIPEYFSSDGPRRIFYNPDGSAITPGNFSSSGGKILHKPDLTAADGVMTTLPSNSGLNPFFGTSAAAPHAGAIAALVQSYQPYATPAQVRASLTSACLDIGAAGFDEDSGQGIVMALTAVKSQTRNTDFNGDGHTDLVLTNASSHQTALWYLNNYTFIGSAYGPSLPAGWQLAAVADFNRDGNPDYLLYNSGTRQTAIWYLSGGKFLTSASGPTITSGYTLVAAADFNGDGSPDYLLYNASNHTTVVWYLSNATKTGSANGPTLTAGYSVAGIGDFNADGHPDLILNNPTTGGTAIWYLSGVTFLMASTAPTIPSGYQLLGVADFNNDSKPDYLLYQTSTRKTVIWYLSNNYYLSSAYGPTISPGFVVVAP
jgi:hypothetical protein